ncbi:MAG: hypothetical protein NT045_08810 [Candidatus Aureabacteria bacterium]|nr:hypothetical protein [Candidatus Auribacterota bacterium]
MHQEQLVQSQPAVLLAHDVVSYGFTALWIFLVATSWRSITRRLLGWKSLQALGCWVAVYLGYHLFYSPWSAVLFAPPLVLPVLLITVPGIVDTWGRSRPGGAMLMLTVAAMLANNLIVINEARLAWQRPALLQSPADRVYLLPGETERAQYLMKKAEQLRPPDERVKAMALRTKGPQDLTAQERGELRTLLQRGLERLTPSERTQLEDITCRFRSAIALARGGR